MSRQHNCTHCKQYERHWGSTAPEGFELISEDTDSCLGNMYAKCNAGNNDVMKAWWDENRDKYVSEVSDTDCYDPTEFDAALDSVMEACDNLISKGYLNEKH